MKAESPQGHAGDGKRRKTAPETIAGDTDGTG